ncbi:MAG: hypothetical protein HKL81_02620, partial [Acidimicrobiaceae bacterium]|nr:hypothetical protein [Acidimicrobiaceae bacterium]
MKVAFYGTPGLSAVYLSALIDAGYDVRYVVTRPDKRRGRGAGFMPSPVKRVAGEMGIEVLTSLSEVSEKTESTPIDVSVVVAYGRIIPKELLQESLFLNIHYSLLPRFRGAAPMERAILAGDEKSGVCLMAMDEGLDTGDVFEERVFEMANKSLEEVTRGMTEVGVELLLDWLKDSKVMEVAPKKQSGDVSYASKIDPSEYRIEISDSAELALRRVRLGRGYLLLSGKKVIVARASLASGIAAEPGSVVEVSAGSYGIVFADGILLV